MNYKTIRTGILLLSFVIILATFLPIWTAGCYPSGSLIVDTSCDDFFVSVIEPAFWSFIPLLAISFILLFFKREIFIAWAKFGAPAFLIMLAVIYYTYNNASTSGGWVNWGSDEQVASVLLPILFFVISLGIIIYKKLKESRGESAGRIS